MRGSFILVTISRDIVGGADMTRTRLLLFVRGVDEDVVDGLCARCTNLGINFDANGRFEKIKRFSGRKAAHTRRKAAEGIELSGWCLVGAKRTITAAGCHG